MNILPDCRAQRPTGGKFHLGQMWYRVSCANCRAEGPYVPEQNMTFAFYLCNPCYESHGAIAGTMVLPDEVDWAKMNNRPLQSPADLVRI